MHVRWGQLYGGRHWRWSWSQTNASGYTALHLAARHSQASTCTALIDTQMRMLPSQAPAAHTAWLHEQGLTGATPSQLFASLHPLHTTQSLWEQHNSDTSKHASETSRDSLVAASAPSLASSNISSNSATGTPPGPESAAGSAASDSTADTPAGPAAAAEQPAGAAAAADSQVQLPSYWVLMRDAWRWRQPPEYQVWANRQVCVCVCVCACRLPPAVCVGMQTGFDYIRKHRDVCALKPMRACVSPVLLCARSLPASCTLGPAPCALSSWHACVAYPSPTHPCTRRHTCCYTTWCT